MKQVRKDIILERLNSIRPQLKDESFEIVVVDSLLALLNETVTEEDCTQDGVATFNLL